MSWDNVGGEDDSWGAMGKATPVPYDDGMAGGAEAGFDGGNSRAGAGGRGCFNCGEEGHGKAECTNPAVAGEFTGACRLCEKIGHRAADCPSKPAEVCVNCMEEGHVAFECKNPRKISYDNVDDVPGEVAWNKMKAASDEGDLDDFKEALNEYCKATPDATYVQLESGFRLQGFTFFLIAIKKQLEETFTNMDLQGNLGKTFSVSIRKSDKHQRPKEKELWPSSPEENMARLEDAGTPVNRGISRCRNCFSLEHQAKACPKEVVEKPKVEVFCFNCEQPGHRVRDCPQARPDRFACRNCGKSNHSSKECPEPRSAEGVECKRCSEIGHFLKDCPQGGGGGGQCFNCHQEGHSKNDCVNERVIKCRNCDELGHSGKECPKPRDYSRVQCQNCQQMGHTKVRCKKPIVEEDAGGVDSAAGGGWGTAPEPEYGQAGGADDWGSGSDAPATAIEAGAWSAAPAATGGGW